MKSAPEEYRIRSINTLKIVLRWLAIAIMGLVGIMIAVVLAGATYQALASAGDARRYPPSGQLIDVGGFRMHLNCAGEHLPGRPVVILEASYPATSSSWIWIQPQLSEATRVCASDRAGAGWSDRSPAIPSMEQMANDLKALLDKAGESGPYLLVGHSWGGGVTRLFAARYPEQVAGLVWIEASHPDAWSRRGLPESTFGGIPQGQIAAIPVLARLGVFRLFPALLGGWGTLPGLPEQQQAELTAYFNSAKWADTVVAVEGAVPLSLSQLRSTGDLGDTALTVVIGTASEEADRIGQELQNELAALSSNSRIVWVEDADHSTLVHDQRYAVQTADVILDTLESIQEP